MAKYVVIESFKDAKTGVEYDLGQVWEGTAARAKALSTDKNRLMRPFIKEVEEK